jgi:mannosyltransferase
VQEAPPRPRTDGAAAGVAVGSAVLATALVVRNLGTKPLWLDEAVSVSVARRPLPRILAVLTHHDANAGVYYVLLHVWLYFGHGAAWDRGISAACFGLTAGLAAWLGSRWGTAGLGCACGVLVATNRFLLFYGQEARPYSLAVLLAVASTAALVKWGDRPAPAAYVAATVALLYADVFAVLFAAAQALAVVAVSHRRHAPLPRQLVRCWVVIAAAAAPLGLLILAREGSQISWLPRPSFGDLVHTFTGMTNGWWGLALIAGLVVALCAAATPRTMALPVLLASAIGPPVVLWVFAQLVPSFLDRYVICSTVAVIGLAAAGVWVVHTKVGPGAALVVVLALSALGVSQIISLERQSYKYENAPAVIAFISRQTRPGDAIGFGSGGLRTVSDLYLGVGPFPTDIAMAPGGEASRQPDLYAREVSAATLAQRLEGVDRLWLVTDPTDHRYPSSGPFAPLRAEVTGSFRVTAAVTFPGMDVTLYGRVAAPASSVRRAQSPREPRDSALRLTPQVVSP